MRVEVKGREACRWVGWGGGGMSLCPAKLGLSRHVASERQAVEGEELCHCIVGGQTPPRGYWVAIEVGVLHHNVVAWQQARCH